eukprot:CAMPEP_0168184718 /NCGR_PEP_ID=MMETSP0139_2-20121125/13398_1 /TAXON_ID=44445 /ORGANISM="Pseudo-nitzschia australis, Strain 10249 10 AB" /LENGTH=461 /DNA_ID=CAMNT_0008106377 /DNA_START=252 /DNA_END=1637 /DNA_ORIENTATION=+
MPQPSYQYQSADAPVLDLSDLSANLIASDDKRQEAYDKSRKFQKAMIKAQNDLKQNKGGVSESITELQIFLAEAIGKNEDDTTGRLPRIANLNQRVEDLCRFMAFHHFLETGKILPPSTCFDSPMKATDEEYLAGACMGLCQDLSRYALGRATARDVNSVQQARDLVNEILDYLLRFDFRNGFLRRKYDGTKYALKSLETLLYELSVTGASLEPESKKPRLEETPEDGEKQSPLAEELDALRLRYEHRDGLREKLIKKSRDGQKAAKQAIYALHRKDYKKSAKLIQECEDCINKELLPIVNEEPPLRSSSFAGVIEEYTEAKLFYAWLLGNDEDKDTDMDIADKNAAAKGTLLLPKDFSVELEPGDYLGGICDLTGEIGRFAVQRGTARDYDGVRQCLEANSAIMTSIESLEKPPNGINKKMGQLRQSVSKIERMIYEMSLSKAAGMKMNSEVKEAPAQEE